MSIERATAKRANAHRSVKLPGKTAVLTDEEPIKIARELRSKSALGRREAKMSAAEAKTRG